MEVNPHPGGVIFAYSARQPDLRQELIRLPLDAAAGNVKGDVPPKNRSNFANGRVTAQIRFIY